MPKLISSPRCLILFVALVCSLSGCQPDPEPSTPAQRATSTASLADSAALLQITDSIWRLASLELQTTQGHGAALQQTIQLLLATPNELTLNDAREQWHLTHLALQQMGSYFALGDINPGLFSQLNNSRFQLDAWPIQPGFLDSFDVYTHSGLVNDIAVPMTAETLRNQHGFSSADDVSLGLHAMAYLLWGEDQNRPVADLTGSTELTPSQQQSGIGMIDLPNNRRRTLLALHTTLLIDDMDALQYRITHSASAVSSAYQSLSADSRLTLWRQALQQLFEEDLLATQLAPKLNPGDDFIEHNQFAEHTALVLQHNIAGAERLLWHSLEDGQQPLVHWLVTDTEQQAQLRLQLQTLQQTLNKWDLGWQKLPEETHDLLQQQLQQIVVLLNPT